MIYDSIINGARSLAFYGGNIFRCWNESDEARGWNWTFWETVLEDLVREINAESPIAPALVSPGTTRRLSTNDATTQAILRQGATPDELWVIAARHGAGSEPVILTGLPPRPAGLRYTEGRFCLSRTVRSRTRSPLGRACLPLQRSARRRRRPTPPPPPVDPTRHHRLSIRPASAPVDPTAPPPPLDPPPPPAPSRRAMRRPERPAQPLRSAKVRSPARACRREGCARFVRPAYGRASGGPERAPEDEAAAGSPRRARRVPR